MAETLPCFLLNVRKWMCSDTVRALHRQGGRGVGAYIFLLCEAWLQTPTGSLPNDEELLIEYARVSEAEWKKIWPVMRHAFEQNGDGRLYNAILKKEAKSLTQRKRAGESGWTEERRKQQSERMARKKSGLKRAAPER